MLYQSLLLVLSLAAFSQAAFLPTIQKALMRPLDSDSCNCTGTRNTNDRRYICGDERLGPVVLPRKFPLLAVVNNYDRFGGLTPGEFLDKFTNKTNDTRYVYPEHNGYLLSTEGKPIIGNTTLAVGRKLDRFGDETGLYSLLSF